MKVKNKKTGHEYTISKKDWDKIKDRKLDRIFTVIDNSDYERATIKIPRKIEEFQDKIRKPERIKTDIKEETKK